MSILDKIKNKKFVIVLHENLPTGPGHDLRDFLLKNNAEEVVYITHPLLNIQQNFANRSQLYIYEKNKLVSRITGFHLILPMTMLYTKDLLLTLIWVMKRRKTYDLFVGLDPLNALAGIILRSIGYTRKVVYYTIDYVPKRYENLVLNYVYHKLDRFCVYFADDTWNVGQEVTEARKKYYQMDPMIFSKQYHLPIGIWPDKFNPLPYEKTKQNKLVYIGSLKHIMGVDLMISTLPTLIKKFPKIHLDIVGGGVDEDKLKKLAEKLKIEKYITFHGWVKDRKKVHELASDASIGLATFNTDEKSVEVKNADPSKVKEYLSMGLPVITTNVVPYYKDLVKNKCAIVIPYLTTELEKAIDALLSNPDLIKEYKKQGPKYIAKFDYSTLFSKALERVM